MPPLGRAPFHRRLLHFLQNAPDPKHPFAQWIVLAGILAAIVTGFANLPNPDDSESGAPDAAIPSPSKATDPTTTSGPLQAEFAAARDVYVDSSDPMEPKRREVLRVGLSKSGNRIYRSFLLFDVAPIRDTHVIKASLRLWNNEAHSCDARKVLAYPVLTDWAAEQTSWSNQPSIDQRAEYVASGLFSHGYEEGGCDNDFGTIDVTAMVFAWVNGSLPNKGLMLGAGEKNHFDASGFCSMTPIKRSNATSCDTELHSPTLFVQYLR